MKKLLTSALALLMLVGCGGNNDAAPEKSTTVCKGVVDGENMEATLDFEGDDLKKLVIKVLVDAGSEDLAKQRLPLLEAQKETFVAQFGEGAEVSFAVEGSSVAVNVSFDVSAKPEFFQGVDFEGTKDDIVKELTSAGLTCK